ncbi:MAG: ABC transporter permease [Firmicutes bacterium]|nr:ABC transporter permease [Bacillota bacterium]HPU01906.1 ABC transporter permease [Bacillota bacterium]
MRSAGSKKSGVFLKTFFGRGFIVKAAVAIALIFILSAIFAPVISKHDPNQINLEKALLDPSPEHILGCDAYGRDVFTRLLYGARVSLLSSIFSTLLAACAGMLLGLVAGYYEGIIGAIILRYVDVQLSIPPLLFTIVIGLIAGKGLGGMIAAISFSMLPGFIRLMNGIVLSIKRNDYIVALQVANIKRYKIILKHLLPNSLPSMFIMFAMNLGFAIMLEATLSFLGIGIQPPMASWGSMVADGYIYLLSEPLLAFTPGLCITLTVVAFNIIGDSLRDAIDPRLRGKL